jgi:nicotinamidase-related amidase
MTYRFVGDKPEPIETSTERWRSSCGQEGWDAVARTAVLLRHARARRLPIIYTVGLDSRADGWGAGRLADKNSKRRGDSVEQRALGNTIAPPIAAHPEDIIIKKDKPSAFFGTLLTPYLVDLQADSVILCGTVTSGCVRATAVDAFSFNYRVSIVEECTADRSQSAHAINLFDLHMKYADVVNLHEAVAFVESLPSGIFDDVKPPAGSEPSPAVR